MKVTTNYRPLFERIERSHDGAVDDTLATMRARAPRRSGRYAASLERSRGSQSSLDGPSDRIGSSLPQANAIEHGANVGPRRGPHMGPVGHLAEAGDAYITAMTRRLGSGL